jgi:PKD repeat protein
MKKTFTRLRKTAALRSGKLYLLLAAALFSWGSASAQYCNVTHYYGCGWSSGTYERYAAIEEVVFEDQNGNQLWKKASDGCNDISTGGTSTGHYNEITTTPTFSLSYGSDFTVKLNTRNILNSTIQNYVGIWLDLNRDGDYSDQGEYLGGGRVSNVAYGKTAPLPSGLDAFTFTIPCGASGSGTTRLRIRSDINNWNSSEACSSAGYRYGETEEFTLTMNNPSTLSAGFFMVDTAYTGTIVNMINQNASGYVGHWWDVNDDGSIEYTSTDATHIFGSAGNYCVRLYSENCLGRDSTIKCLDIVDPTAPPVADFVSDRNTVELFRNVQLTDLSTNGPTSWSWELINADDTTEVIDGSILPQLSGTNPYVNQNPQFLTANITGFVGEGEWTVCLTSENSVGVSQRKCKDRYLEVVRGCEVEMGPGTQTSTPGNVITCVAGSLEDKDDGNGNYSTPEANLDALIAPCGAQEITFKFDMWKVASNVNLKVYDGQDATGIPLHPGNGFTAVDTPSGPLVAKTGGLYFLWNAQGTATDEGFHGTWTTKVGTPLPVTADFSHPDTLYNSVNYILPNTSKNALGEVFYTWEIDGSPASQAKNLDAFFQSNANYQICLTVETCVNRDKICKTVTVAAPDHTADLDFTADNRRPKTGQDVQFMAESDMCNRFLWTVFPGNTVNISDAGAKDPSMRFSAPGKYTVSLRGWNYVDSSASTALKIKDQYIIVIDYCIPLIGVTSSADVATNVVRLEDNSSPRVTLMENTSEESTYTDYTEEVMPPFMTFGGTYNLTVERTSTTNPMSRKVWIDWNIDGDFEDANELVGTQSATTNGSWTVQFTVPDLANSFEGITRMRIGTSYSTDPNEPCGALSGVNNANRIGEFEDYVIQLSNDFTTPVLTLNGNDTMYVEVDKSFTDPGATAIDPTEGNISNRITFVSDLDTSEPGIYFITYDVMDASGNAAESVTRVVYVVVDQTPPVLSLVNPSQNPMYIDVLTPTFNDPGATAQDANDGDLTSAIQTTGEVNTFKIGTYYVTYTVQDAQGNIASETRTVIVRDQEAPVITNKEIKVVMVDGSPRNTVQVQLQSVFVDRTEWDDNYNNGTFAPLLSRVANPGEFGIADVDTRVKGTTTVTYTATDESGNQTQLVIDYIVEDFIAPEINLNTLPTVLHPVNTIYTPVQATVTDNLYDNTQVSLVSESNVNPFVLGTYYDTYTATDASGNVTVVKREVIVYDGVKPIISGKSGDILRVGTYSNFNLIDYIKMTDNYDAPSLLRTNLEILSNDLNTYVDNIYSATFQTRDNSGNVSEPYTLFIVVNEDYPVVGNIGVQEVTDETILTVAPNPSTGLINVTINLPSNETVSAAVYNMLGEKVADVVDSELQNGTFAIDLTSQTEGVYFIRMEVNGKVINRKVVLSR